MTSPMQDTSYVPKLCLRGVVNLRIRSAANAYALDTVKNPCLTYKRVVGRWFLIKDI